MRSVPNSCKEEIRTRLLLVGIKNLRRNESDDYIFISLRNAKFAGLKYCKVRQDIITTATYDDCFKYDSSRSYVKDKNDRVNKYDIECIREKYEILYTAFLRMNKTRQDFVIKILKAHWKLTKNSPNKKISITQIIKDSNINPKSGFLLWRKIRKIIKEVHAEGRVNDLDRIRTFEKLYNTLVGGNISLNNRKWDNGM